jgi:hypothetical protein
MKTVSMLGAAFALALPLLGASRPAAATDVKPIAQAVGEKDPYVITWEDTADGKLDFADDLRAVIHDLFASVQYVLTDSGQLLLVQTDGSKQIQILPAAYQIHNDKMTDFIVHLRTQDGQFLDGEIVRYHDDPSKGYANFTWLILLKNGGSLSTLIDQSLDFSSSTGGVDLNKKSG